MFTPFYSFVCPSTPRQGPLTVTKSQSIGFTREWPCLEAPQAVILMIRPTCASLIYHYNFQLVLRQVAFNDVIL
jgi:hypothetical protein